LCKETTIYRDTCVKWIPPILIISSKIRVCSCLFVVYENDGLGSRIKVLWLLYDRQVALANFSRQSAIGEGETDNGYISQHEKAVH